LLASIYQTQYLQFFNFTRKKDGEAMNLRLEAYLYAPQLLNGMVKIWLEDKINSKI